MRHLQVRLASSGTDSAGVPAILSQQSHASISYLAPLSPSVVHSGTQPDFARPASFMAKVADIVQVATGSFQLGVQQKAGQQCAPVQPCRYQVRVIDILPHYSMQLPPQLASQCSGHMFSLPCLYILPSLTNAQHGLQGVGIHATA